MSLPWLDPGDPFPDVARAWGPTEPAPGLLAAGGQLDVDTLLRAYRAGVFPWLGEGPPVLWWSPDPRIVLHVNEFAVHRSLRRSILRFAPEGIENWAAGQYWRGLPDFENHEYRQKYRRFLGQLLARNVPQFDSPNGKKRRPRTAADHVVFRVPVPPKNSALSTSSQLS